MQDIYYCSDCGRYFTENQLDSKEVVLEDYYGIGDLFPRNTTKLVACCPHCDSTQYSEDDPEEIVELLNGFLEKERREKRHESTSTKD